MVKGPSATLSKARNIRGIAHPASERVTHDAAPSAAGAVAPDGSGLNELAPQRNSGPQLGAGPASSPASRRALKNWRVRSRLFLLVVIPTVTAVAAGGIFIASSVQSALVYQRVLTLANLSGKITGLVQALENEREDTVRFVVMGNSNGGRGAPASSAVPPGPHLGLLSQDHVITDGWADQVKTLADGVGGSYAPLAQQDSKAAVTAIGNLPAIRAAATGTKLPAQIVIQEYATAISTLLAVESQIAVGSSDSTLAGEVRVLGLVSSMKEEASLQQALLTSALRSDLVSLGQFGPALQSALINAQAQQQGDLNAFTTAATPDQRQLFNSVLSGSKIVQAQAQEQQAISLASSRPFIINDPTISDASSSLSYVVSGMRSVEQQFSSSVISRSGSLHDGAITSAVIFSFAVALLLGIALVATTVIGRSMVGPLRRLRTGALEVAGNRLPEMVRRLRESDGGQASGVRGRAHRRRLHRRDRRGRAGLRRGPPRGRTAGGQRGRAARQRQRDVRQPLPPQPVAGGAADRADRRPGAGRAGRQPAGEPVQARPPGHPHAPQQSRTSWSSPARSPRAGGASRSPLVDVVRASLSEVEHYERVTLRRAARRRGRRPGRQRRRPPGRRAGGERHRLLPAGTPRSLVSGNCIERRRRHDRGHRQRRRHVARGAGGGQLAAGRTRRSMDVSVSRRMGLFVVGRLALRHGIRVQLCPVPSGGLIAQVWLPSGVITQETGTSPGPVRSAAPTSGNQAAGGNPAVTSIADKLKIGVQDAGYAMPQRASGRDTGIGPGTLVPEPRLISAREDSAAASRHPLADGPAPHAEPGAATGPLPRLSRRVRPAEPGAGYGPREAGPRKQSLARVAALSATAQPPQRRARRPAR